jgi:hypothetical protein
MNKHTALLAVVLIYAAVFRMLVLNRAFEYDAEGSGCLNGVLARSYLRFDWAQSHGMPILSLDPAHATPIVFYPDHPPMLPLLIVPFYALFGVGAWQTRLPVAVLTLAAILVLYRTLARAATKRIALVGAAIFAAMPMTLYFGGFPDVVGMPLIFFVLLVVAAYLPFQEAPRLSTFIPLAGAFAVAGLCDWPAYVMVPVLGLHFIATHPREQWPWIGAFAFAACVLFAAVYVYITIATHSSWTWMAPLFARRSALIDGNHVSWAKWLRAAFAFNDTYQTPPVLIASALWLMALGFRRDPLRAGSRSASTMARLLLAWAAVYALVGSKALYNHEWAWIPFTPGLAIASALFVDWMLQGTERFGAGATRVSSRAVAALLAVFACWTAYTTFANLRAARKDHPFTPSELGEAIRAAAPDRGSVALLAGGDEAEAQLWFYGDRALRTRISSVREFERRVHDDVVDLPYDFDEQPWDARASGLVFPKMSEPAFAALHAYLEARYPLTALSPALATRFEVFDLRQDNVK